MRKIAVNAAALTTMQQLVHPMLDGEVAKPAAAAADWATEQR